MHFITTKCWKMCRHERCCDNRLLHSIEKLTCNIFHYSTRKLLEYCIILKVALCELRVEWNLMFIKQQTVNINHNDTLRATLHVYAVIFINSLVSL